MNSNPSNTYFVVIGFRLQLVHLEQKELILGELELLYDRSKVEISSYNCIKHSMSSFTLI